MVKMKIISAMILMVSANAQANPCIYQPVLPVFLLPIDADCAGFSVIITDRYGQDKQQCYAAEQDYWNFMESDCGFIRASDLSRK